MARVECYKHSGPKSHAMTARCKGKMILAAVPSREVAAEVSYPAMRRMAKTGFRKPERAYGQPRKVVVYGKTEYAFKDGEVIAVPGNKSTEDAPRMAFSLPSDVVKIDRIGPFASSPCKDSKLKCSESYARHSRNMATGPALCGAGQCPVVAERCGLFGDCARLPRKVKTVSVSSRVSRSNWLDADTLAPQSTPGFSAAFDCSLLYGEQVVKASINALDHDKLARRNPGKAPWGRKDGIGERVIDPRPVTENGSFPRKVRLWLLS